MAQGPSPSTCAMLMTLAAIADNARANSESAPPAEPELHEAAPGDTLSDDPEPPRPVGLLFNGNAAADPVMVAGSGDLLLLRRSDLARVIELPPGALSQRIIAGEQYVPASAVDGLLAHLSDDGTLLILTVSSNLFPVRRISRPSPVLHLDEIVPAAFASYDINYLRWNGRDTVSAFVDGGVSGTWGVLGSTLLVQNQSRPAVRLDTAFQRDLLGSRVRIVVGDTFTRGAEWNLPTRFAGIRIGTDFSLQPQTINFPLPVLSGAATEPSTVDLLSVGSQQSLQVQPGNFLIDYQPVFSGAGEVTMTVTDGSGITRQITRDFYTSPRLLRPGLSEFSVEAGFLRQNYGVRSFNYGDPFVAAFGRHGLADTLTLSGRMEASPASQMAGAGVGWVLEPMGEFSLSAAMSDSAAGRGTFARAQFQRIARTHSFSVSYQRDNGRFVQVGNPLPVGARSHLPRTELALAGTLSLGTLGDVTLGHIDARTSDGTRFRTTSASVSGTLGRLFYNIGVRQQDTELGQDHNAFGAISIPLGRRSNASLRIDDGRWLATAGRVPPNDQGVGFRVAAGRDAASGGPILAANAVLRTVAGDLEMAGDRNAAGEGIRVSARGAMVAVAGKIAATPRIETGFVLVELESEAPVTLYMENRPVVVKGGRGRPAILTGLQPYAENRVAIDLASLPITAHVPAPEQVVVPGYRQAARVRFGGADGTAATLAFVDEHGVPVPPGLDVFAGSRLVGRSGFDGLVFFPELPAGDQVRIRGIDYACDAKLPDTSARSADIPSAPTLCAAVPRQER